MVQHGATCCKMVQDGGNILQDGAKLCKMVQDGARWCKMVQHGATWCNMVQHGATWSNLMQDGARWCKMVRDGARWCEMVQDGARWWIFQGKERYCCSLLPLRFFANDYKMERSLMINLIINVLV